MVTALSAPAFKRIVLFGLFGLMLCPTSRLFAQQKSPDEWEVLNACGLVTNANVVVDGDSFHVRHGGREYIFRLYFVDAPESNDGDASLKQRAVDQAAYFGISPKDIPRAGTIAAQFTRAFLSGKSITIITRWRNAQGRSTLARFYAVALVDGRNLAEELVSQGLARIHGLKANWPDGPRSSTFINKLKNLELTAREKKRGVWDQAKFPLATEAAAFSVASTNAPKSTTLIDINGASYEELQKLPGIGKKLAERIMAHRPYQKVEELSKVPGIGQVKLKRLKPLVCAETIAP